MDGYRSGENPVERPSTAGSRGCTRARHEQAPVRITNPAKTIVDCFKYRNKIGLDIAIEALRDCLRLKRATIDELWHFAGIDRVQNVIRPYLEATV
ncbi:MULTISPECIES: hypothetical protein [unclassified Mesorhizobium]|uniref:type IV toxin-antitoxin system AbiEi family antitoxin domain-containing protein n=1 Tax=unclassified Mesorhizobium TaxID=325217 RepID=UPI0019D2F120|nr:MULTISPECIES: hypothetical protein [unclassified Mesorhizobium]MCT2580497.1 hypothetical protein [Mesorhizobium sp. P13.3]MDF3169439.1 hypothetical protein [Mesorhizobium sp. P16.1]MDF3178899.1 hypothetical protein [Mesorhizobium sp. P17.1]MDF3186354.1 hypothetical protein [Mesorhizobium sp. ICCV3110.1]